MNKNISPDKIVVVTMYKFVCLPDFRDLKKKLLINCNHHKIRGTILLAEEGINATIAGSKESINSFILDLKNDPRFSDLECKYSTGEKMPFFRMKVKLKKEIVTMGEPDIDPVKMAGQRVNAREWNNLISDPEVLVIDTRNQYEVDIGTFKNAISPEINTFCEFPDYVNKNLEPYKRRKIAMFCTGGIRCEKATSYLHKQGFDEVYHLHGGILKYLEEVDTAENLWQGECFVFDGRVSVDKNLEKGIYDICFACRKPLSPEDKKSSRYEEGISCPACYDNLSDKKRASLEERQLQVKLAEMRNDQHIGVSIEQKKLSVF